MAITSKIRSQKWRNDALESSSRAARDDAKLFQQMSEDETSSSPSSIFNARIRPSERSPIETRSRKSRKVRGTCNPRGLNMHEDDQSPSGSSDEPSDVETPTKKSASTRQSGTAHMRSTNSSDAVKGSDVRHQRYCTLACLLGLARERPLDAACPNVNRHRISGDGIRHPLGRKSLAKKMTRQLADDPENGCLPLGKQGARGAMFKLTLHWYGYTFVAKGTVTAFEACLKHEGLVYQHLDELQGELVPVYLGNISLVRTYFLDIGVSIIHMLLMSWGGEQACEDFSDMGPHFVEELGEAVTKLRSYGVEHGDVRFPNVLRNPETGNVMLIDFERSKFLKQASVHHDALPNQMRQKLLRDLCF